MQDLAGLASQSSGGKQIVELFNILQNGVLYAAMFGAKPDGVTDNKQAFREITAALKNGAQIVFASGTYNTSETFDVGSFIGVSIVGKGGRSQQTTIRATHSNGPVIKSSGRSFSLKGLTLNSDSTRYNGRTSGNYGLHIEPPDVAAGSISQITVEDVLITNQPSHGMVLAGQAPYTYLQQINCFYNRGHGLVIDDGTHTSRLNKDIDPGIIEIHLGQFIDNGGNGVALGHPSHTLPPFRVLCSNIELNDNAWDSNVRHTDTQMYVNAVSTEIVLSAFGDTGYAKTALATGLSRSARNAPSGGIYLKGDNLLVSTGRFVNLTKCIDIVGRGIRIERPRIYRSTYAVNQSTAITIGSSDDVTVDWPASLRFHADTYVEGEV